MRIVRYFLTAALLSSTLLIVPGCSDTTSSGPPGDATKAFKSSDDAVKEMNKNNVLPQKR